MSRERIENAVQNKDIDQIPRDLGGVVSGISKIAYEKLLNYWKMPINDIQISDLVQQLAVIDEKILLKLKIDTRHIRLNPPIQESISSNGILQSFTNVFGLEYKKIGTTEYNTLYYEMTSYPLAEASLKEVKEFEFPSPVEEWFSNCEKTAKKYWEEGYAVVADPMSGGILEQTI